MAKTIIGIDPGINGGIAAIKDSELLLLERMPFKKGSLDVQKLGLLFAKFDPTETVIYLEKVHGYGFKNGMRLGNDRMVSFGKGYGKILGVAEYLGFTVVEVLPNTWKRKVLGNITSDKQVSIDAAKKNHPAANLTPGRLRKPSDGLADALNITDYGVRECL